MFHARDCKTDSLFEKWGHMGPKKRKLLDDSWAGLFRRQVLPVLPIEKLASADGEKEPGLSLITHVAVELAHVSDAHAPIPAIEDAKERGLGPAQVLADSLYGSEKNVAVAAVRFALVLKALGLYLLRAAVVRRSANRSMTPKNGGRPASGR